MPWIPEDDERIRQAFPDCDRKRMRRLIVLGTVIACAFLVLLGALIYWTLAS